MTMKISNWAAVASVAMGLLAVGCTVTTTDDSDAGGTSGSGGTAGAGGTAGTAGSSDSGVDSGSDATTAADTGSEAAVMRKCELCIQGNCAMELTACRADTVNGCAEALPGYFTCLEQSTSTDTAGECGTSFTGDAQHSTSDAGNVDGSVGAGFANDLGGCVMDTPCLDSCRTADGG